MEARSFEPPWIQSKQKRMFTTSLAIGLWLKGVLIKYLFALLSYCSVIARLHAISSQSCEPFKGQEMLFIRVQNSLYPPRMMLNKCIWIDLRAFDLHLTFTIFGGVLQQSFHSHQKPWSNLPASHFSRGPWTPMRGKKRKFRSKIQKPKKIFVVFHLEPSLLTGWWGRICPSLALFIEIQQLQGQDRNEQWSQFEKLIFPWGPDRFNPRTLQMCLSL